MVNKRRLARPQWAGAAVISFLLFLTALNIVPAVAEDQEAGQILVKNVRIIDGKDARLYDR